jgi:hypothetical protein
MFLPRPLKDGYELHANVHTSRETKKKTLEEIAASFGDRVVEVEDIDVATEEAVMEAKAEGEHIEHS